MPSTKPPIDIGSGRKGKPDPTPSFQPTDLSKAVVDNPDAVNPQLKSLLSKKKLSPKGQEKFMKELLSALTVVCGAQWVQSMYEGILAGDRHSMKMFAESTALIKAPGGISISMQQNNQNTASADKTARVSFESIARELSTQDHTIKVIEATPVREIADA